MLVWWVIIGSCVGFWPVLDQAIAWNDDDLWSIEPLGKNFDEIWMDIILIASFNEMHFENVCHLSVILLRPRMCFICMEEKWWNSCLRTSLWISEDINVMNNWHRERVLCQGCLEIDLSQPRHDTAFWCHHNGPVTSQLTNSIKWPNYTYLRLRSWADATGNGSEPLL